MDWKHLWADGNLATDADLKPEERVGGTPCANYAAFFMAERVLTFQNAAATGSQRFSDIIRLD